MWWAGTRRSQGAQAAAGRERQTLAVAELYLRNDWLKKV